MKLADLKTHLTSKGVENLGALRIIGDFKVDRHKNVKIWWKIAYVDMETLFFAKSVEQLARMLNTDEGMSIFRRMYKEFVA